METVITVENSRKTYHPKGRKGVEVKALDGISFIVARAEFFGLLGPNGRRLSLVYGALVGFSILFTWIGLRKFEGRALD